MKIDVATVRVGRQASESIKAVPEFRQPRRRAVHGFDAPSRPRLCEPDVQTSEFALIQDQRRSGNRGSSALDHDLCRLVATDPKRSRIDGARGRSLTRSLRQRRDPSRSTPGSRRRRSEGLQCLGRPSRHRVARRCRRHEGRPRCLDGRRAQATGPAWADALRTRVRTAAFARRSAIWRLRSTRRTGSSTLSRRTTSLAGHRSGDPRRGT